MYSRPPSPVTSSRTVTGLPPGSPHGSAISVEGNARSCTRMAAITAVDKGTRRFLPPFGKANTSVRPTTLI